MVFGAPCKCGCVSNADDVGSISWRIDVRSNGLNRRLFRHQCLVRRVAHLIVNFRFQRLDLLLIQHAFANQHQRQFRKRIAPRFFLALFRALVEFFVVGERVRIRPRYVRMNQRRPPSLAAILHRILAHRKTFEWIGAVALRHMQPREAPHKFRNAAPGRLHFHRNRNRVPVVLDQIQQRQLLPARHVQRLPELPLARRPVSTRNVNNLIALEVDMLPERRFLRLRQRLRPPFVIQRSLRCSHRLHILRPGARGLAYNIPLSVAPVRRHLPPAGTQVILRSNGSKQHLQRRHAKHQAKRPITVVGIGPIHSRPQKQPHDSGDRLMPRAGNLKVDLILSLELDFPVIQPPRKVHRAVKSN